VPQIEVTFDIDANGIVNVSAKDLGTGKQQQITVTGSSNLSEEEIEKMKKDAEMHAEEDKKKKEEIETLNAAESLIHTSEKTFKEMEGKVDEAKIKPAKDGIEELKKLMEAEEKDVKAVKQKLDDINKSMQEAATEMYQKAAAEAQQQQETAEKPAEEDGNKKEEVVDADFKVEDDDKKKKGKKEKK
jgi:molecular chaperone DnaK